MSLVWPGAPGIIGQGQRSLNAVQALELAASRRIDIVMFGDSNQRNTGTGFDHGIQYALGQLYSMYASPLCQANTSVNDGYLDGSGVNWGATTGAPSEFDDYLLSPQTSIANGYAYYDGTNVGSGSTGPGLTASSLLDVNADLRGHWAYGTFATGGGAFSPAWRLDVSPFTKYAEDVGVSADTGAYGVAVTTLDLPAGTRNNAIGAKWTTPSGGVDSIDADFLGLWARVERVDRTAGFSASTLYGVGGASLYDMAAWIQAESNSRLSNYFAAIRYLQVQAGQSPVVIVYINSGLNDRNETSQPSLGPNPSSDPDSPEAYVDNLEAIVSRVEAIWDVNSWNKKNLFFLIVPSHPISDPDDAELTAYRTAAKAWAANRPRASVIDLSEKVTAAFMLSEGYYASGGADRSHLVQAGYEYVGTLIVEPS